MKYRTIPNTDLSVSTVGFGLWTVSTTWWGSRTTRSGIDLLRKAYDLGVNFFDTADTYGEGKGETLLAEALGDVRDKIVIGNEVRLRLLQRQPTAAASGSARRTSRRSSCASPASRA